jgi:formylglycine-generating enzyme required for sulfatase activity
MRKIGRIQTALAKRDYKTALSLDPNNSEALALKKGANVQKRWFFCISCFVIIILFVVALLGPHPAFLVSSLQDSRAENGAASEKIAAEILARVPTLNTLGMKLKLISAGTFMMGSPESEADREDDETQHKVTIGKAFYMQTTEVTQGQWKAVMGTEPWKGQVQSKYGKEGPNYAATHVSWDHAVAFCKKLSEREGTTYRLPTEAEWEYACRAGTESIWNFGDDEKVLGDYAWYVENTNDIGEGYAHQVGLKKPNPFGLYDMHGNVSEWCHDYYGQDYYQQSPTNDPQGPESGSFRVLRGGSWFINARYARSAYRYRDDAGFRYFNFGFRVVCELD